MTVVKLCSFKKLYGQRKKKKKEKHIKWVNLDCYLWRTDYCFTLCFSVSYRSFFFPNINNLSLSFHSLNFKGESDGMKTFFQLKCRDSNERKYSMHSWKAKHLLLKGKLWPRKRKRKKRKKEQVQLMGQTKVSWEIFKSTDEFSCTISKYCLLQFSKFAIFLEYEFQGEVHLK